MGAAEQVDDLRAVGGLEPVPVLATCLEHLEQDQPGKNSSESHGAELPAGS